MARTSNPFSAGDRVEYLFDRSYPDNWWLPREDREKHNGERGTVTEIRGAALVIEWDSGWRNRPFFQNVFLVDETIVEEDWS